MVPISSREKGDQGELVQHRGRELAPLAFSVGGAQRTDQAAPLVIAQGRGRDAASLGHLGNVQGLWHGFHFSA
jgi:hypothetical protein